MPSWNRSFFDHTFLVNLHGLWGWSLFAVMWCLAFIGTAIQFGQMTRWRVVSLFLYVGMGWTILIAIKPLISSVATGGIILPDTAKEKPQIGKIIAVGPGKLLDNGKRGKMSVKKNDEVIYAVSIFFRPLT